ncbi:Aspartic peptidase [Gossypium australe]|uniref:Aspartic peptidase n=1 Tax=Gossypium australe TaxID=47621 RepID=A0A5B6WZJ1_9ROSI|nr:Aspartic peptidase [Gossypium australe]
MPKYAKFLKEFLINKRKLEELPTIEFNKECSTILQNKLYAKLNLSIEKALANLGANINLMPYKVFN